MVDHGLGAAHAQLLVAAGVAHRVGVAGHLDPHLRQLGQRGRHLVEFLHGAGLQFGGAGLELHAFEHQALVRLAAQFVHLGAGG